MLNDVAALLDFLLHHRIRYAMIGGMAVLAYGGRASTLDFDFYLLSADYDRLVETLKSEGFRVVFAGDDQCKARFGVLPLDILRADPWLGSKVIQRSRRKKFLGKFVKIATPEDLIVMKTMADRPVDRRDIEELREIFGKKLDDAYVNATLKRLMKVLTK